MSRSVSFFCSITHGKGKCFPCPRVTQQQPQTCARSSAKQAGLFQNKRDLHCKTIITLKQAPRLTTIKSESLKKNQTQHQLKGFMNKKDWKPHRKDSKEGAVFNSWRREFHQRGVSTEKILFLAAILSPLLGIAQSEGPPQMT